MKKYFLFLSICFISILAVSINGFIFSYSFPLERELVTGWENDKKACKEYLNSFSEVKLIETETRTVYSSQTNARNIYGYNNLELSSEIQNSTVIYEANYISGINVIYVDVSLVNSDSGEVIDHLKYIGYGFTNDQGKKDITFDHGGLQFLGSNVLSIDIDNTKSINSSINFGDFGDFGDDNGGRFLLPSIYISVAIVGLSTADRISAAIITAPIYLFMAHYQ
ncbi:MAG: hypothetical protein LBV58_05120 [Acholeplasmatales bacterium]|jgi:hypothetical protein|nr:hypothetical protein [Acholeplasmatales bacterium]